MLAIILVACFAFTSLSLTAFAQTTDSPSSAKSSQFKISDYLKIDEGQTYLEEEAKLEGAVQTFIVKFIQLLSTVIGSFALLFIIVGGMILMVSHGSSQMQTRGKQIILYAAIGLIVAFMSLILVTFVQSLFYTT